jgi:hypothetical protein
MSHEPGPGGPASASSARGVSPVAAFASGVLAGVAVTAAVFAFVLRPMGAPPSFEHAPAPDTSTTPSSVSTPEPAGGPAGASQPEPSRSRGRADWLFFFKPGDQLVRMGDDAAMGMVIRTIPRHAFADGTVGPAYVLQLPDGGGQRVVDADELERGGRLQ